MLLISGASPAGQRTCPSFRILANDYAVTVVLSPLLEVLQREAPKVTWKSWRSKTTLLSDSLVTNMTLPSATAGRCVRAPPADAL